MGFVEDGGLWVLLKVDKDVMVKLGRWWFMILERKMAKLDFF